MLTVTHDIKSPLSSIIGYIELINNTQLEERQHYFLKNMKGSAEHILHLANNMLDFSKLESNKMEINTVPYNPGRLLQETADSFLPLAAQKNLKLKSDISNVLNGLYLGDSMKVRQIVVNILSNAIKYTREGKVSLSAFISGTKDDQFIIVIKDSGPGMTKEEQELIFKEFTRLTPQHNNGAEGTGLGLTITLQLVHLLDGELTLESKKGEGSTFTVKFPLIKATSQESQPTETPSSLPVMHEGMKAFIVDDDILQLTVTTELLRKAGIQCDTCTHPQEALSRLEKGNYNIVLSDIQMPEMDGFELVQQIRESPNQQIKNIPVIALSARDDMHEKEYQEAGFSAYLNKPYTPEQLYSRVNDLLGCAIEMNQPTTQTSDKNAPYNLDMIMVFADNDKDAANQIIGSFISDCKTNFQLLAQHLESHETEQIAKLAHKMLPMFKQLAINDVIPSLLFLEKMPLDTEENKIRENIEKILQEGFLKNLYAGMQLRSDILEMTLNNLNALPGVQAKGILEPGDKIGSSSLTIVLGASPIVEGAVYTDNYGGKYSGRYRYGMQVIVNEPLRSGDRLVIGGMLSNEKMKNYNLGYETAVNRTGGRLGISCAESDYTLGDYFTQAGAVGTAKTVSLYGSQPLSGRKSGNLRLIYGYEHNRLNDELRVFDYTARKSSDVFHLGLTGSLQSAVSYSGYSAVLRAGNLKLRSGEAQAADEFSRTEGGFSRFNFDVNHVSKLSKVTQFYIFAHGQLANRNLDSSEQFYLGGADAVRAYPQGEAGGDSGYQATAELRYQTPVKGMSMTLFADVGEVLARKNGDTSDPHRRLAGWGIGVVYSLDRSLYARLDYARKIKGESYRSEAEDKNGRLWFRLYKLF